MIEMLRNLDHRLFFLINAEWSPPPLDGIFRGFSYMGEWTIGLVALAFLSAERRGRFLRHLMVLLIFLIGAYHFNNFIKETVDRPRPAHVYAQDLAAGDVTIRQLEPYGYKRRSFPSGHAMLAFFFMCHVGLSMRSRLPYTLLIAALVAYARVYVGAHFPSDCLAGALIGAAWAYASWRAFRWLSDRGRPRR